jgi:hypothetical protein
VCVGKIRVTLEVLNRWSPRELDWPVASYTVGDWMSFEAMQLWCRMADQQEATSKGVLILSRKDFEKMVRRGRLTKAMMSSG